MLPPPDARRQIRDQAGVSLRAMGVALEVAPMTVLRWERGEARPSGDHAVRYRRLLDELESAVA
jgi:DNA-binding transcriptional regulator YiaG